MQIGVVYPQTELSGDPAALVQFARSAEELGFGHILAYDHVVGVEHDRRDRPLPGSYTERDPFHDPFVLFAHLAAVTTRIEFATGVLVLPQRQTALVARQASDVDLLSEGRLRLGVGVGWNHVEYEALGQDFRNRGTRQEEQIEVLNLLFTQPVVDYTGRYHRIDRAALMPRPRRAVPIWLGGAGDKAYDRAARLADGFIFFGRGDEHPAARLRRLREHLDARERNVEDFGTDHITAATTDLQALADEKNIWQEVGGSHFTITTMGLGLDTVDRQIAYLTAVADRIFR